MKFAGVLLCLAIFFPGSALANAEIFVTVSGAIPGHREMRKKGQEPVANIRLQSGATILDALVAVGGVGRSGIPGKIYVSRPKESGNQRSANPTIVDAVKALKAPETALALMDGDVVYIPMIVDDFGPPEFFNSLLWGWGTFRSQKREPSPEWLAMCDHLDATHPRGGDDRLGPWIERERKNAIEESISKKQ